MPRSVTALFPTRADAEAAMHRLGAIGVDAAEVQIADQGGAEKRGFFDHLTDMLLPDGAAALRQKGFLLTAEVNPDRVQQAASMLATGAIASGPRAELREQVFEFPETAEELLIEKRAYVREELVMRKETEERTETIEDTVRHTEVEVERLKPEPGPFRFGGRETIRR
jgi:hypothetical protein